MAGSTADARIGWRERTPSGTLEISLPIRSSSPAPRIRCFLFPYNFVAFLNDTKPYLSFVVFLSSKVSFIVHSYGVNFFNKISYVLFLDCLPFNFKIPTDVKSSFVFSRKHVTCFFSYLF